MGIGVDEGVLTSGQAAMFIGAGMLTVLLFPLVGMAVRGQRVRRSAEPVEDDLL